MSSTHHAGGAPDAAAPSIEAGGAADLAPEPGPPFARAAETSRAIDRLSGRAAMLRRLLRDPREFPDEWRRPGFVLAVTRVLDQLRPIPSRAALAESFAREGVLLGLRARSPDRAEAIEVAYATRWLELADAMARIPSGAPSRRRRR